MDQKTGPLDFKDTLCIFIAPFSDHFLTVRAHVVRNALRALRAVLAIMGTNLVSSSSSIFDWIFILAGNKYNHSSDRFKIQQDPTRDCRGSDP